MKRILIFMLCLVLCAGVVYAKGLEVKQKAGVYNVTAEIDRNPPVVGRNNIDVVVIDGKGKTITDAQVRVYYSMPAMPGMPPMNYKTDAKLQGDTYKATMNLSMAGPWNIEVKIKRNAKISAMKFNIDVR